MSAKAGSNAGAGRPLLVAAAVLLGLAIQAQITLPLGAGAVRINAADLLAAPLALWALARIAGAPAAFWRDTGPAIPAAIFAVTLALTLAFARGTAAAGALIPWAAVKYAGWFALLAYLAAGYGLARFAGRAARDAAVLAMVFGLAALALLQLLSLVLHLGLFAGQVARFYGLAGNPNTLALMFMAAFVLSFAACRGKGRERRDLALTAAAALNLAGVILTGSLAAFLILPLVIMAMLALRTGWRRLAAVALLALLCIVPARLSQDTETWSYGASEQKAGTLLGGSDADPYLYEMTIGVRIESLRRGLAEWRANPLLGAGLGMHLVKERQRLEDPAAALQIHNTPVWLLAETGLAGLAAVAALFLVLLRAIFARAREDGGRLALPGSLPLAAIILAVATLAMSMAHEFMYQRIIWLVLGLALGCGGQGAAPAKRGTDDVSAPRHP